MGHSNDCHCHSVFLILPHLLPSLAVPLLSSGLWLSPYSFLLPLPPASPCPSSWACLARHATSFSALSDPCVTFCSCLPMYPCPLSSSFPASSCSPSFSSPSHPVLRWPLFTLLLLPIALQHCASFALPILLPILSRTPSAKLLSLVLRHYSFTFFQGSQQLGVACSLRVVNMVRPVYVFSDCQSQ